MLRTTAPGSAEAVTRRLVAEFWAERDKRGTINLPMVTPSELRELLERACDDSVRARLVGSNRPPDRPQPLGPVQLIRFGSAHYRSVPRALLPSPGRRAFLTKSWSEQTGQVLTGTGTR